MYSHLSVGDKYGGQEAEKIRRELWQKNNRGGAQAPFLKIKSDPRVTRVGRFLRRTKLDEIPQFWNVLKGDMILVGPRPPIPTEVEKYQTWQRRRLSMKPGITCIWQVSGRAEIDFPGQVNLDVTYIDNQCLKEDMRILARTPKAVIFGHGAY